MTLFSEMSLSRELEKAIAEMGFETPSPIQEKAIPLAMAGRDLIGQAQTGTGKTAAFGIPLLEKIDVKMKKIQNVILCPTRELAIQVSEELSTLAKYKKGMQILPVYGGQPIERQLRSLQRGVHIVVGTPGRVMDHMKRGTITFSEVLCVVLDEADEMFDMGFRDNIESILSQMPKQTQYVFFSATMPPAILDLARSYLKDPEIISITPRNLTVPAVEQIYFDVKPYQKRDAVSRLLDVYDPRRCIVFCSTKKGVDDLTTVLQNRGYSADALHGNLSQTQRDRVMDRFRKGAIDVLVATDVAARGIDIDEIDLVINFDLPNDVEIYVHRIGRTGRAGRKGKACTLVTQRDYYRLRDIKRHTKAPLVQVEIPTVVEVVSSKSRQILEKTKHILSEDSLSEYAELLDEMISQDVTPMALAGALLKICLQNELGKDFDVKREDTLSNSYVEKKDFVNKNQNTRSGVRPKREYGDKSERKTFAKKDSRSIPRRSKASSEGMTRLFFNVGRQLKVAPKDILGAITGEANIAGKSIGAIEIHDHCTFVEVADDVAHFVLETMNGNTIKGYQVKVQQSE
ncbi:MAG: DEAD/DEAH box helicase [Desulfovibrionaceae bacterium]